MHNSHQAHQHTAQFGAMIQIQRRSQRGFTLVECAVTLAITAFTLGAALPTFTQARERHHLEGAAAQLATDIRHARGLAVAHNAPLRLSVQQTADGSCYVVHTGHAGDCVCTGAGVSQCSANAQALRTVGFDAAGPVRMASNSKSMLFDPDRGTVTPTGTFSLQLQGGQAIRQVVNIMGRVRACSPAGAMPGYPAC